MSSSFESIIGASGVVGQDPRPLHGSLATRALEQKYPDHVAQPPLMQRAGLCIAELALAIAPHARSIWVACGPGNNGQDGLLAAHWLQRWGKTVYVTLAPGAPRPHTSAQTAAPGSLQYVDQPPHDYDLAIDALFGIGTLRPFQQPYADWIAHINRSNQNAAAVLAVDLPSGLDADTGTTTELHVRADHTLSLLTLKPGLFTRNGRDACGQIWLHRLQVPAHEAQAVAILAGAPSARHRLHESHKGSFGDVAVIGGSEGMQGAAVLCATAALHAGAGRVFLALTDPNGLAQPMPPEIMQRDLPTLALEQLSVVAGCGGGEAISAHLADVIGRAQHVTLDADALNAIAKTPDYVARIRARPADTTVLTPHPLEAARLLETDVATIQQNRLGAASTLSDRFQCTVLLKGSGTVICAPGQLPYINPTGNARLATAGSGDVLAGLIGARMAGGQTAWQAACAGAYLHGQVADRWPTRRTTADTSAGGLTALSLAQSLTASN